MKIPSKWYRRVVGGLEVLSGFVMAFIPNRKCYNLNILIKFIEGAKFNTLFTDKIKNAGNITLLSLMLLLIYNHYMISDIFERIGPTLVFSFMLTGRLVVWYQISRREAQLAAAAQTQANGIKQE